MSDTRYRLLFSALLLASGPGSVRSMPAHIRFHICARACSALLFSMSSNSLDSALFAVFAMCSSCLFFSVLSLLLLVCVQYSNRIRIRNNA